MKKLVATLIATGMLVGIGTVLGQGLQSHEVVVTLPDLLSIRLVDTTDADDPSAEVLGPDAVVFDLGGYTVDTFVPDGSYSPTNVSFNWDDVVVFANSVNGWQVTMALSADVGGFEWSKVSVAAGLVDFDLGDTNIASAAATTEGWLSLGFGPADFVLTLDGTEVTGTYSTTVTYTISALP